MPLGLRSVGSRWTLRTRKLRRPAGGTGSSRIAAFATAAIAAIRLGEVLDRAEVWRRVSGAVTGLGYEMVVALIALGTSRRTESLRGYFGLVEHAFYAGAIAFFLIVGVQLVQH